LGTVTRVDVPRQHGISPSVNAPTATCGNRGHTGGIADLSSGLCSPST
jgi:hypothetical protein